MSEQQFYPFGKKSATLLYLRVTQIVKMTTLLYLRVTQIVVGLQKDGAK
jgi:hypothetical protein